MSIPETTLSEQIDGEMCSCLLARTMRFCDRCQNMCYLKTIGEDADERMAHYCRKCNESYPLEGEASCVLDTYVRSQDTLYEHAVNPYVHLDPTLPRTRNVPCPNDACPSRSGAAPEVLYIRYNDAALAYVYLCVHCGTAWKTES